MRQSADPVAGQADRFAAIDPLLPAPAGPVDGETLVATLADGSRVTGVLRVTLTDPHAPEALWSALETWELTPFPGEHGTEGMDALLRACRARLDAASPGLDSALVVTWPSRDAEATRALLDHGLVPLSALAVRTGRRRTAPGNPEVVVRRARAEDTETVVRLERVEMEYSTRVGNIRPRPGAAERRRATLREQLVAGLPVWIAELDGTAVGIADGGWTDVVAGTRAASLLPAGRWGYLHSVAVLPDARGRGVGRAITAEAHATLARRRIRGTYLYYNPPNPLSSVFWHRQGYRPLWTIWEARPATALR
ncbi:GNAT family N-acetyltransferase [Prauserella oleivorans]|uniref:GNAT family N-acetyltransferase n=1 Tax=Prauserella oleivorans TaxID=1478153 RepID=A0ABW5WEX7_9PSEU